MSSWDAAAVRHKLLERAASAQKHMEKTQDRMLQHPHTRPTGQVSIDMSAAEAAVCGHLAGAEWTDLAGLLATLRALSGVPVIPPATVKNSERFLEQFRRTCEQLLRDWAG